MCVIKIILPSILTILGNVIFYFFIKKRVDSSIEQYKITYSGVFKEKIDIYRELLRKTYSVKYKISNYQYNTVEEEAKKIRDSINEYIEFYLINQPFLSEAMLKDLNEMRTEFQKVYEGLSQGYSNQNEVWENAIKRLRDNKSFKKIEESILNEMRKDLKIENFD